MTVTKLILLYALTLMDEYWLELLPIYFSLSTMVIYWAWQGYIGEYTPSGLNNISLGASRLWIYCTTPLEYIIQYTHATPIILSQYNILISNVPWIVYLGLLQLLNVLHLVNNEICCEMTFLPGSLTPLVNVYFDCCWFGKLCIIWWICNLIDSR